MHYTPLVFVTISMFDVLGMFWVLTASGIIRRLEIIVNTDSLHAVAVLYLTR